MLSASEYRPFQLLDNFVQDIYECSFFQIPLSNRIAQIPEIAKARTAIANITEYPRFPYPEEFFDSIYPILEVALQWDHLRKQGNITHDFLEKSRKRMGPPSSNFRGTIFEIDMATRCLLSGWETYFPEDYAEAEKQIDLIVKKQKEEIIALECTQKRGTDEIDVKDINEVIEDKSKKFDPDNMKRLERHYSINIRYNILVIDITRRNWKTPVEILSNLENIVVSQNMDGVVLTWRESRIPNDTEQSLFTKYKCLGNMPDTYFSATLCAEFRVRKTGTVLFLRKYVEPEPAHGDWGLKEVRSKRKQDLSFFDERCFNNPMLV